MSQRFICFMLHTFREPEVFSKHLAIEIKTDFLVKEDLILSVFFLYETRPVTGRIAQHLAHHIKISYVKTLNIWCTVRLKSLYF